MRKGTSGDVGRTVAKSHSLSLSHIPMNIGCDESDCVILHWFRLLYLPRISDVDAMPRLETHFSFQRPELTSGNDMRCVVVKHSNRVGFWVITASRRSPSTPTDTWRVPPVPAFPA